MRKLFAFALLTFATSGCRPASPPAAHVTRAEPVKRPLVRWDTPVREEIVWPKPKGSLPPHAPSIDIRAMPTGVPMAQGSGGAAPPPSIRRLPGDKPI